MFYEKKVFLEISQNLQEDTSARVSFLIKKFKKRLWHRCFLLNFAKFLRTTFFIEHLWWLLLLTKTIVIIKDIYGLELRLDLSPIALLLGIVIVHVFYTKKAETF